MNFFLPFRLQGSRIENSRRIMSKKSIDCDKDLESEFFAIFGNGRSECFYTITDFVRYSVNFQMLRPRTLRKDRMPLHALNT